MKVNAKQVNLEKVRKAAEDAYRDGYFCCEALMFAICNHFQLDVPQEVIKLVSGMSVGIGRSGCTCGALNGGIAALGMFFGRTEPTGPQDPVVNRCMALTHELHDWFRDHNGKHAVCCRVLTRGLDMVKGEHKEQCIRFTGLCAWKTAEIICRELHIETVKE